MATKKKTSKRVPASAKRSTGTQQSLVSALASIQRAAKRLGARWYLFGAQAVALHGIARTTADIDVTLLVDASTKEIVSALKREGIVARFDDEAFVQSARVIPADHESGWPIDVVLGGPGLEEIIALEAQEFALGKLKVPVVKLEHLLTLKILASRAQDAADVARLIAARRKDIDADEVRQLLRSLEEALAEDGLLARFDGVWRAK